MSCVIELDAVEFVRARTPLLTGLRLQIAAGERVALVGPSGSGKTTVLRLVLGLETPSSGDVRLEGQVVSTDGRIRIPTEERRLAAVFQDLALWPHMSVRDHLSFGLDAQGVPRPQQEQRIGLLLERLGLADKDRRYPSQLSGGEQQRVAIARALVLEPRAVLLDEPLANLDVRLKRELLNLFRELFAERRSTVLYVTHDLREAAALTGRIVILEGGQIVQEGTLRDLREQPRTSFVRALLDDLSAEDLATA